MLHVNESCEIKLNIQLFHLILEVVRRKSRWEEEMKAAMAENERELQQIKQTYEEKLRIARQAQKAVSRKFKTILYCCLKTLS